MGVSVERAAKPTHGWLKKIRVAFVPGPMSAMLEEVASRLVDSFEAHGHILQDAPDNDTDVLLTTARFGEPLGWRDAMLFSARRKYNLDESPTIYTLIHVRREELERTLDHFADVLKKDPPDPEDFKFPGLAPDAYRVLVEQGLRGGPIMSLERLLQAQSKSIRIILVVGEEAPEEAFHFDLVGAHPRSLADDPEDFYSDIVMRITTSESTSEVTTHKVIEPPIARSEWDALRAVSNMRNAALQLDKRGFFTVMVRIGDLVQVPAVADSVASQYSEGCFATWESGLRALIATVTGSARPVDKGNITEDDLAVIVGLQPDGSGAQVRHVEGKRNDPPSSESVEMMDMDRVLPAIRLNATWGVTEEVPVVRSKLHGHRAIGAFDPRAVEYAPLDPPYYHYLVSCATAAQAQGIKEAFSRAEALQNPSDPRKLVFTVLPGHGCMIAEKWVENKAPFQIIWEAMDAGQLQVINKIPQGPMAYRLESDGHMVLESED
jgi:hypothetical protein